MTQMNIPTKQRKTHRHREQIGCCQRRDGLQWTKSLGLADTQYYIKLLYKEWINNKVLLYIAQGTLLNIL